MIFMNFTNHPSEKWSEAEKKAALQYGSKIADLAFPAVDPLADQSAVQLLAHQYVCLIMQQRPAAVLCQGDFYLSFAVAALLQQRAITVLVACSERNSVENHLPDGSIEKKTVFSFIRFRELSKI